MARPVHQPHSMLFAAWLLLAAGALLAFAGGADPAMTSSDRAFMQAIARSDRAALTRLLDPDFVWIDYEGKLRTRAQVLQSVPAPSVTDDRFVELKRYTYGDLGNVQANIGRAHGLRVWARRGGVWKAMVYQEVLSRASAPLYAPGAGKDCENPCLGIPFTPSNDTERAVAVAYSRLETAAMGKNSAVFSTMVGDEFVAASSNSDKLYDKRGRMDDFDHSKNAGVAPTPFVSGRMFAFGDAVLMTSDHVPDRGRPLHVTRVWVKRDGNWQETLSYQTSVLEAFPKP